MHRLELLDCYPLNNGEISELERQQNDMATKLGCPPRFKHLTKYANNAYEFAQIAAEHNGANNAFNMQLEQKMKNSPTYKSWTNRMPGLCNLPAIDDYRDDVIKPSLLEELRSVLTTLSPGQFLFHGGAWPAKLKVGSNITINRPLSTSLNANPAIVHAYKDCRENNNGTHVWIIEIGPNFSQPVYAFNIFTQRRYNQEFEVLIHPGAEATCRGIMTSGECTLVSVLLN